MVTKVDNPSSLPNIWSLFSVEKDYSVKKHLSDVYFSNGLAWNKDNSIMYYTDTIPGKVYAFDFDTDTGTISMFVLIN